MTPVTTLTHNTHDTHNIKLLEAEMARTQKNKATNYHLGTLKAKLAKLKSELLIEGGGNAGGGPGDGRRGFN